VQSASSVPAPAFLAAHCTGRHTGAGLFPDAGLLPARQRQPLAASRLRRRAATHCPRDGARCCSRPGPGERSRGAHMRRAGGAPCAGDRQNGRMAARYTACMGAGSVRTTSVMTSPGCTAAATTPQPGGSRRRSSAVNSTCTARAALGDHSLYASEVSSLHRMPAVRADARRLGACRRGWWRSAGPTGGAPGRACCGCRRPARRRRPWPQSAGRPRPRPPPAHASWTPRSRSAPAAGPCSAARRNGLMPIGRMASRRRGVRQLAGSMQSAVVFRPGA